MSGDEIVLTSAERSAAAAAAQSAIDRDMRHYGVVDAILVAINETRRPPKGFEEMTRFEEVRAYADREGVSVEKAMIWLINAALSDGRAD